MNPLEWFTNKFAKPQQPQLPRSQRELQEFRQFKQNEVQTQVNKDAKAGKEAIDRLNNKTKPTKPTPKAPQKGPLKNVLGRVRSVSRPLGIAYGAHQLSQGNADGLLTMALSSPLYAGIGATLNLLDQRPAGGALYDENGKPLMPTLTPQQQSLSRQLQIERDHANPPPSEKPDAPPQVAISEHPQTEGADYTVAGVTYDGKTHRPKGAPDSSYTLEADGSMTPHAPLTAQQPDTVKPTRPGDDGTGLNTGATVDLSFTDANNLLSRGGNKENPGRFLASGVQLADVNSFLPAPMPVSGNDAPAKPVDNSQGTELAGDQVAEGVVTQQQPSTISADGADNTRSVSVPGEPEGPVNYMEPQKSADAFLRARRAAFLDLNNRGYGAIRAADAAVGRFRQGDKFFYNDAGTLREVDEQTWRKGQHQAINPVDTMEKDSKFMEGWKDSKIKPTLVPSEQTDITNPDADGGQSPVVSDFNENNIGPVADSEEYGAMLNSQIGPVADGDVYGRHLQRAREKTKAK